MDLYERKAAMRDAAQQRRKAAHDAAATAVAAGQATAPAEAARDHFLAAGLADGARVVSAYRRIRSELDPLPLMLALIERGCRLCVPVMEGKGLPLKFREWTPTTRMQPGPFGAQVPVDGDWLQPDLLVVPLLAFDATGLRLGYGGGFYDRTIEGLRAAGPVRAVGFAYAAQQVDAVPADETDQRLDAIVTEAGHIPIHRPIDRP